MSFKNNNHFFSFFFFFFVSSPSFLLETQFILMIGKIISFQVSLIISSLCQYTMLFYTEYVILGEPKFLTLIAKALVYQMPYVSKVFGIAKHQSHIKRDSTIK